MEAGDYQQAPVRKKLNFEVQDRWEFENRRDAQYITDVRNARTGQVLPVIQSFNPD